MTKIILMLIMVSASIPANGKEIKVFSKKYPNGEIKEEYQYYNHSENNMRMKSGWYNSYRENGSYYEVGTYKDNEKHGDWIYHSENGKKTIGVWENGKKHRGEFWINVKVDSLGAWVETKNDLRETDGGQSRNVYKGLFTYEKGLWDGLGVSYWKNGNKIFEGHYEDGKRDGASVWYYEDGKIQEIQSVHF